MRSSRVGQAILAASFLLSARGGGSSGSSDAGLSGVRPQVSNASAQSNQYNVLSSLVKADVSYAVKVHVTYTAENGATDSNPEVAVTSTQVSVPVLGLKPKAS